MSNKVGRIGVGSIVQMKQNDRWIGYVLEVKRGKALAEFTSLGMWAQEGSSFVPMVNRAKWITVSKLQKLASNRGFGPRIEFVPNGSGGCADIHWS